MTRAGLFLLAATVSLSTACASGGRSSEASSRPKTTVEVENQALVDMTVYVLRGSQRVRLGQVTALTTKTFTIPESVVFGATTLRFLADPLGGRGNPVSEEIIVSEGEQIVLRIPSR